MQRPLQDGFSTGTAASAAAFAAVHLLFDAPLPETVAVLLPPFCDDGSPCMDAWREPFPTPARLIVPVAYGKKEGSTAFASIIKNGGDDPDVTHGARIIVHASAYPFPLCVKQSKDLAGGKLLNLPGVDETAHAGRQETESAPCRPRLPEGAGGGYSSPIEVTLESRTIVLYGGVGVGTVTLPGLPAAIGEPAINPIPRRQIAMAAMEAADVLGYAGPLHLLVSVPDGEARAKHTLNARLGIIGGLSILGTRGTVRPYSHEAWKDTVRLGLDVAAALGLRTVLLATGRRSERLGFALYPALSPQAGIQVADYAAFSLREAVQRPFTCIIWVCFPGKLLKLAQGLQWTHATAASADMELLASYCREAGGPESLCAALRAMPTVSGAFALLQERDARLGKAVLERLAQRALSMMRYWLQKATTSGASDRKDSPELTLRVFSTHGQLLL
ncbi:MAG: cobalt-precorrin-5B (C(1))-methyltransferase CbiD [Desulfovibrio sp.]|jgi:cobalt-precorrin-5B (C1)-methyltransferase|nr:cobalt-precorrin-5B (C(1))-methyltransferase CbiD [Desulfovibrio sp.]